MSFESMAFVAVSIVVTMSPLKHFRIIETYSDAIDEDKLVLEPREPSGRRMWRNLIGLQTC